jgi:hypothetical protein
MYLLAGTILCIIISSLRLTKYTVHFKNPLVGLVKMYYNRSMETKVSMHNKMLYDAIKGEYNVNIIR